MASKYKRILLKLSGEVLAGEEGKGINFDIVTDVCERIKKCTEMGVQIGLVVGGGNFWRGRSSGEMDRTRADHMGMLATCINALALCDTLQQMGVKATVQTAISMPQIADTYTKRGAVESLEKGEVVIFAGGLGVDVYSMEPMSKDHPFQGILHLPNVCLTPHMAWGGYETRVRLLWEMAKNIESFTRGEKRNRID